MEGILKVTPEHLLQTSGEFNSIGGQIRSLSEEMLSLIRGLSAVWEGEAAAAYGSKFDALSPDMDRLYRMVQEHVQDLQEMAGEYQKAESGSLEQGSGLESGIIV